MANRSAGAKVAFDPKQTCCRTATLFVLMGIAVLYGAWRPFGQIAILDVQFQAAAAVAEFLVEESSPVRAH
jgi:hypothetical protein